MAFTYHLEEVDYLYECTNYIYNVTCLFSNTPYVFIFIVAPCILKIH